MEMTNDMWMIGVSSTIAFVLFAGLWSICLKTVVNLKKTKRTPVPWTMLDLILILGLWLTTGVIASQLLLAEKASSPRASQLVDWNSSRPGIVSVGAGVGSILNSDHLHTQLMQLHFEAETLPYLFLTGGVISLVVVVGGALIFILRSGATLADLGWDAKNFWSDVKLGLAACILCTPILMGLKLLIAYFVPQQVYFHSIIRLLVGVPSTFNWGMCFVVAVIIAPIYEEFFYRLMLQGYLEKVETEFQSQPGFEHFFRTLPALWMPALLFAAGHLGAWPDPIPLFFFALMLGYLYRRTHRITPIIIMHLANNGLAMLILWISMQQGVS